MRIAKDFLNTLYNRLQFIHRTNLTLIWKSPHSDTHMFFLPYADEQRGD